MMEKDVQLMATAKLLRFTEPEHEVSTYDHCLLYYRPELYYAPILKWMEEHKDKI